MDAYVLVAFYRTPVLHCRKEAPLPQRREQDLVKSWVLCRLEQIHVECAVRMDGETGNGDHLIALLAKVIRQLRQRLGEQSGFLAPRAGGGAWTGLVAGRLGDASR